MAQQHGDDSQAWLAAAVDRYAGPLGRYALGLLSRPEAARDAVQDTFLRLCRAQRDGQQDRLDGHLAQWLFTVCRNRAMDLRRKERTMGRLMDVATAAGERAAPSPADLAERAETAGRAVRLLADLPARQREVVRLKFQNGFSYRQIAEITGLTVSHVGVLIHTAVKTLRAKLRETAG